MPGVAARVVRRAVVAARAVALVKAAARPAAAAAAVSVTGDRPSALVGSRWPWRIWGPARAIRVLSAT